ncbi:MAG: hypothetical protein D6801_02095 [Alphaproteobacteria bacterium]|nr:MAG: hypothetical protein D6801_02095 [Alphaproteobacteria bacterium]
MYLDVRDLKTFYYRSALGRAAQRAVREPLRQWWADTKGQTVVGFGFAAPLLRPFLGEARRVIALMPAAQGAMPWPAGQPNVTVLTEESLWPVDTGAADRLVLMHGLENASNPDGVLQEASRALGPGGRMVIVVPNRAGLWSRSDATPFGFGRPYTPGQLEALLRWHGFSVERHTAVLFQPPSARRFWLKIGAVWERAGHSLPLALAGGVLMTEVVKQVPAPRRPGLGARVRRPLGVFDGLALPEPSRRA